MMGHDDTNRNYKPRLPNWRDDKGGLTLRSVIVAVAIVAAVYFAIVFASWMAAWER
jgi:hypothetical protein